MNNNCIICEKEIQEDFIADLFLIYTNKICIECHSKFKLLKKENKCPQCFKWQKENNLCPDCELWNKNQKPLFNKAIFKYDANFSVYMHRYKYMGDFQLRKEFTNIAKKKLNKVKRDFDLITTIPVSNETFDKRLFNQVEGIFGKQEQVMNIENKLQMSGLSPEERRLQKLDFKVTDKVQNMKILLLDDVYTTGTTMHTAAQALYTQGARDIQSLTLAR